MNFNPPSGPVPETTFELLVKALAFTTVAVRLAGEDASTDPEIRSMATLLAKLVPQQENMQELEAWAMKRLMSL